MTTRSFAMMAVKLTLVAGALTIVLGAAIGTGRASAAGSVEERIAQFWERVNGMAPTDYLSSSDLGQWALNVIERDSRTRLTVADFRAATAAMQGAMDRAGPAPVAVPTPTPTPAPTPAVKRVGDSATYTNGWKITLLGFGEQGPGTFSTPKAGFRYVYVLVRFDNNTTGNETFNSLFDFEVQDSSGVRRSEAFYIGRNDDLNSGTLTPGGFVTGSIVFEVPASDTQLKLIYEPILKYLPTTWQLY